MRNNFFLPCFLLLSIFLNCSEKIYAQVVKTSESSGNWNDLSWTPAGNPSPQENVQLDHIAVIPEGTMVEVNDLNIGKNGKLTINGILKVRGSLTMANNGSQFEMGPESKVIVYGDFLASNKVQLSISSYLVIYGNFIKNGSDNQGDFEVDDGHIYIFGEVDMGKEFSNCGDGYDGDTTTTAEDCDYGNQEDYEDNQEDFPDDLADLVNCYDLSAIDHVEICQNGDARFQVDSSPDVHYRWQKRRPGGAWNDLDTIKYNTEILELSNVSLSESGNEYRVVVTPVDPDVQCSISISRNVTLTVISENIWTGNTSTDWNTSSNWSCNALPTITSNVIIPAGLASYPVLSPGSDGLAKNINIETGASIEVNGNQLQIGGSISNAGTFNVASGSIAFVGTTSQVIPSGAFANSRIQNLTIANAAGVTSQATIEVTGILKVENGTLDTGNLLTLVSNEIQTALIDGAGTGPVIGEVKMQRYLDNAFGYKYFSSPFQNSTVGDFSAYVDLRATFPNFYSYNEDRKDLNGNDATGWETYATPTSSLEPLNGYAINFGNSVVEKTVEISGIVNNGNYSRTLYNHNGLYTQGFNLVGNPYPSPIDWDATTGWTKTNVDDAIYFFTTGTTDRYTGTYTSYVNGIQSGDGKSSNIIPSMQGFFVHVSDLTADDSPTTATLGMTNDVRINDFSQDFLKTPEKAKPSLIRISAGYENEERHDPLVIYFDSGSSRGFEKDLDAHKLMNTAVNVPNFYSITPGNEQLAINAIPPTIFREPEKIPLGITAELAGSMLIKLQDLENVSTGSYIYLIDKKKRIAHDLNDNPEYRFTAQKGQNDSRFSLLFSPTRISDPAVAFDEPFSVVTTSGRVVVKMNLKPGEKGNLRVTTVNGQILDVLPVQEQETVEIQRIRSEGIYFISYVSGKEPFTKKVLVKK